MRFLRHVVVGVSECGFVAPVSGHLTRRAAEGSARFYTNLRWNTGDTFHVVRR